MQYLHDFVATIEWWKLEPAHELIRNQPDEVARRMVLARIPGRDLAVAYLPDNDEIAVNLSAFSAPAVACWLAPVRGRSIPLTGRMPNQGHRHLAPPAKNDWLLVIERPAEGIGSLRRKALGV